MSNTEVKPSIVCVVQLSQITIMYIPYIQLIHRTKVFPNPYATKVLLSRDCIKKWIVGT